MTRSARTCVVTRSRYIYRTPPQLVMKLPAGRANGRLTSRHRRSGTFFKRRCKTLPGRITGDLSTAPTLSVSGAPDASRPRRGGERRRISASVAASAACPTLSVSEHIFHERSQKPSARYSHWLTGGSLHGSLLRAPRVLCGLFHTSR